MSVTPAQPVFRALADDTRRALLDELADRDGQTLFELCARLATRHGLASTRQAVSQHVTVLEEAGLVRRERVGRHTVHHLDLAPVRRAVARHPWLEATPPPRPSRGPGTAASVRTTTQEEP